MRITFVAPPVNLSGGVRVIAIHAERLRRRGHDVLVVAPPNRQPTSRKILRSLLRGRGWPTVPRVNPSHFETADVEVRLLDRFRPVCDDDVPDADVVIATWWETAEWVAGLSPSKGAKVHFVQHHEVFASQPIERVEAAYRLPLHKITISQWLIDVLRDHYGNPNAPLVPNAVDSDLFHAPPRGKNVMPTVGFMYSATPFKGCDMILEALARCAGRLPELRVITFGNRAVDSHLPLPAGARHVVTPPQQEIRTIYAACDAWLFGSRTEGFGLPILEAMACRTPVIGTPAGAAPQLLGDGGGILVRPEDPEAMAEAIVRLCHLPESEWRSMSDTAYATATGYTWDDAADRFEQALMTVIEQNGRGPFVKEASHSSLG